MAIICSRSVYNVEIYLRLDTLVKKFEEYNFLCLHHGVPSD